MPLFHPFNLIAENFLSLSSFWDINLLYFELISFSNLLPFNFIWPFIVSIKINLRWIKICKNCWAYLNSLNINKSFNKSYTLILWATNLPEMHLTEVNLLFNSKGSSIPTILGISEVNIGILTIKFGLFNPSSSFFIL